DLIARVEQRLAAAPVPPPATAVDKGDEYRRLRLQGRFEPGEVRAQATTALQVAIALAAIAVLTRKKWLEFGMYGVAAVGLGVGLLAFLHI
ncbi:MAG: SURF1 family cytochrome oxidase biogenesis protein, partial [Burkholderiaceae bacterium]